MYFVKWCSIWNDFCFDIEIFEGAPFTVGPLTSVVDYIYFYHFYFIFLFPFHRSRWFIGYVIYDSVYGVSHFIADFCGNGVENMMGYGAELTGHCIDALYCSYGYGIAVCSLVTLDAYGFDGYEYSEVLPG